MQRPPVALRSTLQRLASSGRGACTSVPRINDGLAFGQAGGKVTSPQGAGAAPAGRASWGQAGATRSSKRSTWGLSSQQRRCFAAEKQAVAKEGGEKEEKEKEDKEKESAEKAQDTDAAAKDEKKWVEVEIEAEEQAAPPSSAAGGEETEEPKESSESPKELLEKELAEVSEKVQKEKHALLLALADFENNKKKHQKECATRRRTAIVNFANKVVEVYDQFDALAHLEDQATNPSEACTALSEGIALTRDLYRTTLEKFDVEALKVEVGAPLVERRHENVGNVEDSSLAVGMVAELVKPGWILEPSSASPTVLRRAQVKVARQGPETPPAPPS